MIYAATTREPNIVFCDPVETRTRNPLIKSEVLWPIELRSHFFNIQYVKELFGGLSRNRTWAIRASTGRSTCWAKSPFYFLVGIEGIEPACNLLTFLHGISVRVYLPIYVVLPTRIELAFLGWKPNVLTVRRRENFTFLLTKKKEPFGRFLLSNIANFNF